MAGKGTFQQKTFFSPQLPPVSGSEPIFHRQTKNIGALRSGDMSKVITLRDGIRMSLPGLFAAESANKGGEIR